MGFDGGVEAERLAEHPVQAFPEVVQRLLPDVDPAARRGLVDRPGHLGHEGEAVVRRKRDEKSPPRIARLQRVEKAAELHVEAPQRVELFLGFVAVVVRDGIVAGKGEAEEVGDLSVSELQRRIVEEREREVGRELVHDRAPVDASEVARRVSGRQDAEAREVVVEAESVHGILVALDDRGGDWSRQGLCAGRGCGRGRFLPRESEAARKHGARLRLVELPDGVSDGRGRVVRRRGDEAPRFLVVPVDRVGPFASGQEDGSPVLRRERDDARALLRLDEAIAERRDAQVAGSRHDARRSGRSRRIGLVRAVDGMERTVRAGFEPAVQDDSRDARRRAGAERGVAGPGLGVQVLVARGALDVSFVEEPLQARDEPRPVSLEAGEAEPVHRDHDGELRRGGRRGGGDGEREGRKKDDEGAQDALRAGMSGHRSILPRWSQPNAMRSPENASPRTSGTATRTRATFTLFHGVHCM